MLADYEAKIGKYRFFHVAFARMMELTNKIAANVDSDDAARLVYAFLLQALYPYAPHLMSELWAEQKLSS